MVLNVAEPSSFETHSDERFDDLFRRLYGQVFSLTYRLLGDRADTEDILQEAFSRLADSPVLQQPDDAVSAWLRRVCLNLGTNKLRQQRRAREHLERVSRLEPPDATSETGSPVSLFLRQEQQAAVRRALGELPERQRNCLLLRHSGYSYAEVALTLGISVGSVGVYLARGERAFRETYQEAQS